MSEPREIHLPPGKLGLTFLGSPATVSKKSEDCTLEGIEVGETIVEFSIAGQVELTGLKIPSTVLGQLLADHSESPDRILKVWQKGAVAQPGAPKNIPQGKKVLPGGTWWKRVRNMDDSVHMDVTAKQESFAHSAVYKEPGEKGRWLNKYGTVTRAGSEEYPFAIPQRSSRMDCTYKVWLPEGSLGLSLKGCPGRVSKVAEDSPLWRKVKVGQQIVECSLGDEVVLVGANLTTAQVGRFLVEHTESKERTLKLTWQDDPEFGNSEDSAKIPPALAVPATVSATTSIEEEKGIELPENYEVVLPAGTVGISFKGTPSKVSRVAEDSPLVTDSEQDLDIKVGQKVVHCSIDGKVILSGLGLSSREVGKFLMEHADKEGRTMLLTVEQDLEFAKEIESSQAFALAVPDFHEKSPPEGAAPNGTWIYKEPGLEGRMLDQNGQEVKLAFSVLTEL